MRISIFMIDMRVPPTFHVCYYCIRTYPIPTKLLYYIYNLTRYSFITYIYTLIIIIKLPIINYIYIYIYSN